MRRVPDPRTTVALRVSGSWWNSFLAVAPIPRLSHVASYERRSRPPTCGPRMSAVAVDSLMVLRQYQGVGLPRLCGTLAGGWCRGLSRTGQSTTTRRHCTCQHCKHRPIGLACIALGDCITSPATPMFFGSSDSWMLSSPVFPSWKSSGHRAHLVFHHKISTGGSHVKAI